MTVIERALERLAEEERQHDLGADNEQIIAYWAAYLDGAKAQIPKDGEWRGLIIDGQYWAITCSNCHQVGFNARTPYCPNCGACMDSERKD